MSLSGDVFARADVNVPERSAIRGHSRLLSHGGDRVTQPNDLVNITIDDVEIAVHQGNSGDSCG